MRMSGSSGEQWRHHLFILVKGFSPQEVGLPSQTSDTEDSVQMAEPLLVGRQVGRQAIPSRQVLPLH
jgi:hypothetical protein